MHLRKMSVAALAFASVLIWAAHARSAEVAPGYFRLHLTKGTTYRNVFSRAFSIRGAGFDEIVHRESGAATYTVIDTDPDQPVFQSTYRYDGSDPGAGRLQIRDGGRTHCAHGQCQVDAETSGLSFDPVLWGMPPPDPKPGMTWHVRITQPWELGPAGSETVTVASTDAENQVIMLDREGSGSGESDSEDLHTVTLTVGGKTADATIVPGASHWSGQTVFRRGIILSDVLLLERPVTLVSKLGTFHATERAFTLLNAMPSGRQ